MMFEVEQKIDWSLINEQTKDRNLLISFFIDGDKPYYAIVGNEDFVIVRTVNGNTKNTTYYVQKRTDYVKQQNGFFWNTGKYNKD